MVDALPLLSLLLLLLRLPERSQDVLAVHLFAPT
jgi:hypothetical protein